MELSRFLNFSMNQMGKWRSRLSNLTCQCFRLFQPSRSVYILSVCIYPLSAYISSQGVYILSARIYPLSAYISSQTASETDPKYSTNNGEQIQRTFCHLSRAVRKKTRLADLVDGVVNFVLPYSRVVRQCYMLNW